MSEVISVQEQHDHIHMGLNGLRKAKQEADAWLRIKSWFARMWQSASTGYDDFVSQDSEIKELEDRIASIEENLAAVERQKDMLLEVKGILTSALSSRGVECEIDMSGHVVRIVSLRDTTEQPETLVREPEKLQDEPKRSEGPPRLKLRPDFSAEGLVGGAGEAFKGFYRPREEQ